MFDSKEYYQKNKERIKAQQKQYYQEHKEEIKRRSKDWAENNKERKKEYDRLYNKKNRRKITEREREYRRRIKKELLQTLGTICYVCGYDVGKYPRFHEKYCKKHETSVYYVRKHIEDFIVLCTRCHNSFHTFQRFKQKFEELLEIALSKMQA